MRLSLPVVLAAIVVPVLLVLLAGCEPRVPTTRGMAAAVAGNVCLEEGLNWGEPVEVLEPGEPDAEGHRWWQVRYFTAVGSAPRVVVVDDASTWGRRPPAGYAVRIRPLPQAENRGTPLALVEGSHVYVLVEPGERTREDAIALEREAVRLNTLAAGEGVPPLFLARTDAHDRVSLLYGWQGDHGIQPNPNLTAWLAKAGYSEPRPVDLLHPDGPGPASATATGVVPEIAPVTIGSATAATPVPAVAPVAP